MGETHKVRVRWSEVTTYDAEFEVTEAELLKAGYDPGSELEGWTGVEEYVTDGGGDGMLFERHDRREVATHTEFQVVQVDECEAITFA